MQAKQGKDTPASDSDEDAVKNEEPKRRYKKFTHADRIGKTAGRWTRQEHIRFMQGNFDGI